MKIIFYVTDVGLTTYNDFDGSSVFYNWHEVEQIHELLSTIGELTEVSIVLDVIDEDIYFEWAPKVLPWEKVAIASRRKDRVHTEETVLSEVHWTNAVRKNEEGRKDELLLTSTIGNSFQLRNFLETLEEAQVLVTNIYSKPFLLSEFFHKRVIPYLKINKQQIDHPFLMVTRQSEFSFRQTFFYEGQLRISRLIELDRNTSDITSALIKETRLAITYVYNQQIVPFNSPVGLVFLDGDRVVLDSMLERCREEALVPVTWQEDNFLFGAASFQDLETKSRYCGDLNSLCFSQQAIADFVFNVKPKGFYTNEYVGGIQKLLAGKKAFIGFNIILLIATALFILNSSINTYVAMDRQERLLNHINEHQAEITRLEETVKLQDDAQQVKASVEFSEAILKLKLNRLIGYDINGLSDIIARHRHIHIDGIEWKTVDRFDSRKNEIVFSAWVYPFIETYEEPVKWVDALVSDLQTLPTVDSVKLQKEPLNRQLSQALTIDANLDSVKALPFSVTLRVKDHESK